MKDTQEDWKIFPLDERYEVSNWGRVRRISTQRIRKTPIKQNGYPGLVFTHPGRKSLKGYDLHTMVAITWIGGRPKGFDVSHQDGNKLNNCIYNLKYESRKENASKDFNKYNNGSHHLDADLVLKIRMDKSLSNNSWAKLLGVGRACIWKIRSGKTWKHLLPSIINTSNGKVIA